MYIQYGSEATVGLFDILPTFSLTKETLQLIAQHTMVITIRYVGAREMKRFNIKYRSNRKPGNILTFCILGFNSSKYLYCDLILHHRLIMKESLNYNKNTQSYYMELFAKGILNVQSV
ncbi:rRNA maturation RNAse YbeY [Candidatus Tremblaya phenacola]|uniref:rRNA maturation RNAse YbeY n=1 Tax=Candidatus Tremblayella phenacoccinincola TaxID=1010676 RepID=UPI0013305F74|nr:rRNA maturation RNAse YbeY [Candidatus Tremblaya phenacola]KAH0998282.1 hypothetical protein FKM95_000015 [Candidatus Tremblaya phenacola]